MNKIDIYLKNKRKETQIYQCTKGTNIRNKTRAITKDYKEEL